MSVRFFKNPYDDYNAQQHGKEERDLVRQEAIVQLVKEYVERILIETRKPSYKLRDDLYVGEAGIAFMFWKLSQSDSLRDLFPCLEHATFYIERAKELFEAKGISGKTAAIAFLCGNAGTSAVSAVIAHSLGKREAYEKDVSEFLKGHLISRSSSYDADEVLVGRAGYLNGAYWLNQTIEQKPIGNHIIEDVCKMLIKRGREYSASRRCPLPLMYEYHDSDYLGAAHGLCSILHALLESPWFAQVDGRFSNISSTKLTDIKKSIDHFLSIQDDDGNFPTRLFNSNKNLLHWCHGCPGAIYLLAKAFLIFKETKFLDGCRKCADSIWQHGLLYKGPGLCHGIAGNGYAFLLMYRLTGERRYLYRAGKFMEFLQTDTFLDNARIPDRPFSLYEGLAGTVCYLADLLDPTKASFPFMDVFEKKFRVE